MAVNVPVRNTTTGKLEEIAVIEVGAPAGGALTGNYPDPTLPDKIAAGTVTYPSSITFDAKGDITAATSGSPSLTEDEVVLAQASTPGTAQAGVHSNIAGTAKAG